MNIGSRLNRSGTLRQFYFDFGRGKGQRPATGDFIYVKPKTSEEKAHNKETLKLIAVKKSKKIIEKQSIGTPFIPAHKFKANFLDYYAEYVTKHTREGNRHLQNSFIHFKNFIQNRDFFPPVEITTDFCKLFRQYLLDRFNGETPLNYFARFKWVVNAATDDKYFVENPIDRVAAKANPSTNLKEILEVEDYIKMVNTPFRNEEIRNAFLFCCYTSLRWVDVKRLRWTDIKEGQLVTRVIQKKTGLPVVLTLHPIAMLILDIQRKKAELRDNKGLVFTLPTANGANKCLDEWMALAKIDKHITWSCARLSFSILLQDKNVEIPTVAYLMGHATPKQVMITYKRYRPKNQMDSIRNLPDPTQSSYYLSLAG